MNPPGAWAEADGQGRREQPQFVPSGCSRRGQEVIKKRTADSGFRLIDGRVGGGVRSGDSEDCAAEQMIFFPLDC